MKFDKTPSVGADGEFLKIEAGKSVTGVFQGDVHTFPVVWKDGKSTPCDEHTPGAKFRFRINFVMNTDTGYKAFVWEQGAMVYNQLKEFHGDYSLEKTIVKVSRIGDKLDTTYSFLPSPKGHAVNESTAKILKEVQLQDLKMGMLSESNHNTPPKTSDSFGDSFEDNLPF